MPAYKPVVKTLNLPSPFLFPPSCSPPSPPLLPSVLSFQRIPPDIARLINLSHLDLSGNKLRSLPAELGDMTHLRELLLNNNALRVLPYELGKLFLLQTLGLSGNPLQPDILSMVNEVNGTAKLLSFLLDNLTG